MSSSDVSQSVLRVERSRGRIRKSSGIPRFVCRESSMGHTRLVMLFLALQWIVRAEYERLERQENVLLISYLFRYRIQASKSARIWLDYQGPEYDPTTSPESGVERKRGDVMNGRQVHEHLLPLHDPRWSTIDFPIMSSGPSGAGLKGGETVV